MHLKKYRNSALIKGLTVLLMAFTSLQVCAEEGSTGLASKTYTIPAPTGQTFNTGLYTLTDNVPEKVITSNTDYFMYGGGFLDIYATLDVEYSIANNYPWYKTYYMQDGEVQYMGGSLENSYISYNWQPKNPSAWATSIDMHFVRDLGKAADQTEMYKAINVWPLYNGASAAQGTASLNNIGEAYGSNINSKFNWSLNAGYPSYVVTMNTWDTTAKSFQSYFKHALRNVSYQEGSLINDDEQRKFTFTLNTNITADSFTGYTWEDLYAPVYESRNAIQEVLRSIGLEEEKLNNKTLMSEINAGDLDNITATANYGEMGSCFKSWYEYWSGYLGNMSEDKMWEIWCTDQSHPGTSAVYDTETLQPYNIPMSQKVYLPYIVQLVPEGLPLNLKILDAKKPVPSVSQYTTCVYDKVAGAIKLHPYGIYDMHPTDMEKSYIEVELFCDKEGVISPPSNPMITPVKDMPKDVVVDFEELPDIPVTPHPTEAAVVTIKLTLNPEKNPVETKVPLPYEDNVIIFTILIPSAEKVNNLKAIQLSSFNSVQSGTSVRSCNVNATYGYYNVVKENMPNPSNAETQFKLSVYTHRSPQNSNRDMSNLQSATQVTGTIPIAYGVNRQKTHPLSFNIDGDYEGYVTLRYEVNTSKIEPKNETTYDDNVVWLTVYIRKEVDTPATPPNWTVKFNDRVTMERSLANAFQTLNGQDLKHDGVPHATGTVPCLPTGETGWYAVAEAGKFVNSHCTPVNWSPEPVDVYPNEVPENYVWGEPKGDIYEHWGNYCSSGTMTEPCPDCGCMGIELGEKLILQALGHNEDNPYYYISFVWYTDKFLKQEGNFDIDTDANVPDWTTRTGSYCHSEFRTETDSDGDSYEVETRLYNTDFRIIKDAIDAYYRIRYKESNFEAFDYKSGTDQSKAGYGFGIKTESQFYTDFIENPGFPGKAAGFIQFPYYSTYSEPYEITWLTGLSASLPSSRGDFMRFNMNLDKNLKDLSKQPIGYRYSVLEKPEKFTHVNLPNGPMVVSNLNLVCNEYEEAWSGGVKLPEGNGTRGNPYRIVGTVQGSGTGIDGMHTSIINIDSNMWNDSYSTVDEGKSGTVNN